MARKRKRNITFSQAVLDEEDKQGPYIRNARIRGLSENTLNDYQTAFAHWLRIIGDRQLRTYTVDDVEDYLDELWTEEINPDGVAPRGRRQRAPKTVKNYYVAISALWTWAVNRNYAGRHIVRQVYTPKARRAPVQPLTKEEIVALVRATAETRPWRSDPLVTSRRETAERDKALILLLYETAMRISEAVGLRIGDLEFNRHGGKAKVTGKGNKDRWVRFGRRCGAALQDYIELHNLDDDRGPLFINITRNPGRQMNRTSAGRLIKRLGKKAGIDRNVTPHLIRITAACHLATTLNAFQLKEVMGHERLETTMRYVEAANLNMDEAMRRASPVDNLRL